MLHAIYRLLYERKKQRRIQTKAQDRFSLLGGKQTVESAHFGKYDLPGAWRKALIAVTALAIAVFLIWVALVSLKAWNIFS